MIVLIYCETTGNVIILDNRQKRKAGEYRVTQFCDFGLGNRNLDVVKAMAYAIETTGRDCVVVEVTTDDISKYLDDTGAKLWGDEELIKMAMSKL